MLKDECLCWSVLLRRRLTWNRRKGRGIVYAGVPTFHARQSSLFRSFRRSRTVNISPRNVAFDHRNIVGLSKTNSVRRSAGACGTESHIFTVSLSGANIYLRRPGVRPHRTTPVKRQAYKTGTDRQLGGLRSDDSSPALQPSRQHFAGGFEIKSHFEVFRG